jgi:integrase
MAALRKEAMELASSRHAPKTLEAYGFDWRDFTAWCHDNGREALPADPDGTVAPYLVSQLKTHKVTSVERRLAAIAHFHQAAGLPKPVTLAVRAVLSGSRRRRPYKADAKAALTVDELRQVVAAIDARGESARGARDKAAILLAFAGAFRRSEVAALDFCDVAVGKDRLTVHLARGKVDQLALGRTLTIPVAQHPELCAVAAMRAWIVERGRSAGPLFYGIGQKGQIRLERMKGDAVYYALLSHAKRAGLDSSTLGAHSLRAGAITASADAGSDVWDIMALSGHRSVQTVQRYVRRSVVNYPLRKVL